MTQEKALLVLKSGRNVFLTGSAGTGKTYVLNKFIQHLKDAKLKVAVTASTGIAATHLNGSTIHSWAGIGIKNIISNKDLTAIRKRKSVAEAIQKTDVLIIDEISMLHQNQLNAVDEVLRYCRDSFEPFGGVQLVVSGDFFQLPPIGSPGDSSRDKFAFMASSWLNARLNVCYLTEQYRQENNELHTILSEIRAGAVSKYSVGLLMEAQNTTVSDDLTKLYTHNVDVDFMNNTKLADLPGKSRFFKASVSGKKTIIEQLKNSVTVPESMALRIGAQVMFVKNNPEKGYVNGTIGTVEEYSELGLPRVKTLNRDWITVNQEKWSMENEEGKVVASFSQLPLKLAWAITVHKSQGMTLDGAELDLTKTFEPGQGYVALSRLKSLNNLKLKGFNQKALEVDALARKADQRFQELSFELNEMNTEEDLLEESRVFIRKRGGRVLRKL